MSFTTPDEPVMTTPGFAVRLTVHLVAEHVHRETEDVEADGDVRRRGRRERRGLFDAPLTGALRGSEHTRSRSANTPAAVTSGPAPGPCTISGLVL